MTTLHDNLTAALKDLTRLLGQLEQKDRSGHTLPQRIHEAKRGHPVAAAYDTIRGSKGKLWCWEHERDLPACHKADMPCQGENIVGPTDRTGEEAIQKDVAAADEKRLESIIKLVMRDARLAANLAARYPQATEASAYQRSQVARSNVPGCDSCCRIESSPGVPQWSVIDRYTEVKGKRMGLCSWCYKGKFGALLVGDIPPRDELIRHHQPSPKVRVEQRSP